MKSGVIEVENDIFFIGSRVDPDLAGGVFAFVGDIVAEQLSVGIDDIEHAILDDRADHLASVCRDPAEGLAVQIGYFDLRVGAMDIELRIIGPAGIVGKAHVTIDGIDGAGLEIGIEQRVFSDRDGSPEAIRR